MTPAQPDRSLWRRAGAETVATFTLVFMGCGAIIASVENGDALGVLGVAAAFGLVVMAMVLVAGGTSGAHMNPAVTAALILDGRTSPRDGAVYIAAQLLGASVAAVLLVWAWGADVASATVTTRSVGVEIAFVYELLLTAMLMTVIVAVSAGPGLGVGPAAAIGGAVAIAVLVGGPVTGASINPARSFGPALATGIWTDLWIYLTAPVLGAGLGIAVSRLLRGGRARGTAMGMEMEA